MPRPGMIDVCQAVERKFSVSLEAFGRGAAENGLIGFVAGVRVHGIDNSGAAGNLLQAGVEESIQQAVAEGLVEIANFPEFFLYVAVIDLFLIKLQSLGGLVAHLHTFANLSLGRQA